MVAKPPPPIIPPYGNTNTPNNATAPDAQKLQADMGEVKDFQKQVIELLKKFQKNRLIDAESKQYQKQLEALIRQTNYILKHGATKKDSANLEALLDSSNDTYQQLKAQHADDTRFQKQFVKTFGTSPMAGSISHQVAVQLGTSLKQLTMTVRQAVAPIAGQSKTFALNSLTGPFGAMLENSINFGAIKQYIKGRVESRRERKESRTERISAAYSNTASGLPSGQTMGPILGAYAEGTDEVPRTGPYLLHQNERVVPPTQNQDLTQYLERMNNEADMSESKREIIQIEEPKNEKQRVMKVYDMGHSQEYFDPLIDSQNQLNEMNEKTDEKFRKELGMDLELIKEGVYGIGEHDEEASQFAVWLKLSFTKFMRHPIWNTLYLFGVHFPGKLIEGVYHLLFGKRRTEAEEIMHHIDDVTEAILKGKKKEDDKTAFSRFLLNAFTFGGLTHAQRVLSNRARFGRRAGLRGVLDSLSLVGFHPFLNEIETSREVREDPNFNPDYANPALHKALTVFPRFAFSKRYRQQYRQLRDAQNRLVAERQHAEEERYSERAFGPSHPHLHGDFGFGREIDTDVSGRGGHIGMGRAIGVGGANFADLVTTQHRALFYLKAIATGVGAHRGTQRGRRLGGAVMEGSTLYDWANMDAATRAAVQPRDVRGRFMAGHKSKYSGYEIFEHLEKLMRTEGRKTDKAEHLAKEQLKAERKTAKETEKTAKHAHGGFLRSLFMMIPLLLSNLTGAFGGLLKTMIPLLSKGLLLGLVAWGSYHLGTIIHDAIFGGPDGPKTPQQQANADAMDNIFSPIASMKRGIDGLLGKQTPEELMISRSHKIDADKAKIAYLQARETEILRRKRSREVPLAGENLEQTRKDLSAYEAQVKELNLEAAYGTANAKEQSIVNAGNADVLRARTLEKLHPELKGPVDKLIAALEKSTNAMLASHSRDADRGADASVENLSTYLAARQ